MIDRLKDFPERIEPYILLQDPSQPVPVASGPFRLVGPTDALLDGHLVFRWLPSTAVEFEGSYAYPHPDFDAPDWALVAEGASAFHVPVLLTHVAVGSEKSTVRGISPVVRTPQPSSTGWRVETILAPDRSSRSRRNAWL